MWQAKHNTKAAFTVLKSTDNEYKNQVVMWQQEE